MKKHMSKILAMALALCMMVCMSATAFAAEIKETGGTGTVPVVLSSVDDEGNPAPTALSVTVPTALPLSMKQDGTVIAASKGVIINNSFGAVRVRSVTISAANGWTLTNYDVGNLFAADKVDSNKLGFSIGLGNGAMYSTTNENENTQTLISAPVAGCYMSGASDTSANTIAVRYSAICTPVSSPVTDATIANVVFVVEWDT